MDLEKLTERARGFLQAAQTIAVREHHQRIAPAHLLKALLDDEQGMAAGLIQAAGGDPKAAQREADALVAKVPSVTGSGATSAPGARRRHHAHPRPGRAGREESRRQLRHGRAHPAGDGAGQDAPTSARRWRRRA